MNIFITGGTGFVGSWLVKRLLKQDAQITLLVHDDMPQSKKVNIVRGSVEDYSTIERAINEYEPDTIVHLAAQPLVGMSLRTPLHTFEVNIRGTYNLLEACRHHKDMLKAIVIASSDKAYGEAKELPYTEETRLSACYPYEVSKASADMLAQTYFITYGLPVTVMRCGNIYGGGDLNWSRIIPGTIRSLYHNESPVIRSNGKFLRDYIYVKDVVNGILRLIDYINISKGQAFNFGTNNPVSVLDLVNLIQELMQKRYLELEILDIVTHEIVDQYLSLEKSEKLLSWKPTHFLEDGLLETIEWYKGYFLAEEYKK